MTCLGDDDVTALLAGRLAAEAFAAAEKHLDECRGCRLLVSTLAIKTGDQFRDGSLNAFGPGDTVGDRYRIAALLGSGGMGEVYAAFDTVLGETVALKTIASGMAIDDAGVSRLKAEVQVARRITHRNICRVFDVGFHTDDDTSGIAIPFFTMELLAGETLRTRLRRDGPMPPARIFPILEQMAAGLDAAHGRGVVHRDLKTENVMLVPEDGETRVVITDFGLAHQTEAQRLRQMPVVMHEVSLGGKRGEILAGTLAYMAPEQLAGGESNPATDLYGLGVVLFELLSGELPFRPTEILACRARNEAPRWPALPAAPPAWDAAIRRCLETAPGDRFASAGDLLAALGPVPAPRPPRRQLAVLTASAAILVVGAGLSAFARFPTGAPAAQPPATVSPSTPAIPAPTEIPPTAPAVPTTIASPAAAPAQPRRARRTARSGAGAKVDRAPTPSLGADDFVDPFESR
jgi:serine/threonine protein kinase